MLPSASYWISSNSAGAKPIVSPPWICPSTIIGLMRLPQSSTATNRRTFTYPPSPPSPIRPAPPPTPPPVPSLPPPPPSNPPPKKGAGGGGGVGGGISTRGGGKKPAGPG